MASVPDPLVRSEKRCNSARLGRLIFKEGVVVLRSLFDSFHTPSALPEALTSNNELLHALMEKKLLSPGEWKLLFPDDASLPSSQNMEARLLFLLLQNICGLPKPSAGWNGLPSSSDSNKLQEKLAKLKWLVNEVASQASSSSGIETFYFSFYWGKIFIALNTLEVHLLCFGKKLKDQPLDEDEEDEYHQLLIDWAAKESEIQHQGCILKDSAVSKVPFTWSNSSIISKGCNGINFYRGQLTSNGKEVAVKKVYLSTVLNKNEAETLRRCKHPNIIRCFGTYKEEDICYIALELCEKILQSCIDENVFDPICGDLLPEKCFLQVMSGMVYLHECKICHRDIKPDNIILVAKSDEYSHQRFILADFSCATYVSSREICSTQHSTVGTPGWMAPEMCQPGLWQTFKVDIFSLGCVFYYTLTNKEHPYGDLDNIDECQRKINRGQKPIFFVQDFGKNAGFIELIEKMVHPEANRRPRASEVYTAVERKLEMKESLRHAKYPWIRVKLRERWRSTDAAKTEELYRKVTSILNKLTPQKFQTLMNQILELDIDTPERLEGVVERIFEKAISEPGFSVAYANMCRSLMMIKVRVQIEDKEGRETKEGKISFRKILLNKCQKEFEKEKSEENLVHAKMDALAQQGVTEGELKSMKAYLEVEETKMRRRSLGNIRFTGELFKLKMLTENVMHDCVVKLLRSTDEESYECLCKLLTTVGKNLDHEKAKPRVDLYFEQIKRIIQARRTSSTLRFMMIDLLDLRKNNWVSKREDNSPKTIDQIHREAQEQEKKTVMMIQQAKLQKRANRGGRDCLRNVGVPHADDGWTSVAKGGAKKGDFDPKKFQNISKERVIGKGYTSLGPGGQGYGSWARGSSGRTVSGSVPSAGGPGEQPSNRQTDAGHLDAQSPVTPGAACKRGSSASEREKALEAVKRLAVQCLKDLISSSMAHVFVATALESTLEEHESDRRVTGQLFSILLKEGLLTVDQFVKGMEQILEFAEDMEIDVPHIWRYFGELIGIAVADRQLPLKVLGASLGRVQKRSARKMLSDALAIAVKCSNEDDVGELWANSGLQWSLYFESEEETKDFLQEKKLDFTLQKSRTSSPAQRTSRTQDELRELILKRKARNQEVFEWIDRNFEAAKTKEAPFIRDLVTAVCEASVSQDGNNTSCKCDQEILKSLKNMLQKYIDGDSILELQALFALQSLAVRLHHPPGLLKSLFDTLYDEDIISEDSFYLWERCEDSAELKGKGFALKSTTEFFRWLRSATEESDEEY